MSEILVFILAGCWPPVSGQNDAKATQVGERGCGERGECLGKAFPGLVIVEP